MALSLFLLLDNLSSPKPHAALSLSKVVSILIITNTIITTTITIIYVHIWSNHPPRPLLTHYLRGSNHYMTYSFL